MLEAVHTDAFVSRYRPLLELGRGGMARVYLAESLGSGLLRKLVVLKVLNQDLASDPEMRQAFVREAEISARLNHPNIVNVYEVFEQGHTAVMVMQHLDGMALSEVMSRLHGVIPLKLHLSILCQVLDALHYFHELKDENGGPLECVHRDVSPHNVMILHEGGIKVVDFGVAKVRAQSEDHTRTGVIKGKVAYMPPEQLLSCATVDRRADIYSVGVMLWEAVANRRMWRGMDASARMRAIVQGDIPDLRKAAPGVSDALVKIVERALAHTPDGRYETAEELQIDLEQVTFTEGGHSLPRELSGFMRDHFGDERREKQRVIEKAVRDREFSLPDTSWSSSEGPSGVNERSAVHAAQPAPSVAIEQSPRWRKLVVGAALVAALTGVVGAATMLSQPAQPSATAEQPANAVPAPVMLRVESEPAGAEVYVEGTRVGVTPLTQTRPSSAEAAEIELRAPGRVTQSKVVRLQDDVALSFTLQRADEAPARAGEATRAPQGASEPDVQRAPNVAARGDVVERRQVPARPRRPFARPLEQAREKPSGELAPSADAPVSASPAAKPPAAKVDARPEGCDPPYRLDSNGVKIFKSHCF